MPEPTIENFNNISYELVKERRNGTRILRAEGGEAFVRVGAPAVIAEELRLHRRLIAQGYPVPEILEEGVLPNGNAFFREASAGDAHFGELFRSDVQRTGVIEPETFDAYRRVIEKFVRAQESDVVAGQNWESVFLATHVDVLIEELPEKKAEIMAMWEKAKSALTDVPFVLCHGDFNPFNILRDGVIDFETAFEGPFGYDLVSACASIRWFPTDGDAEFIAGYAFSATQREQLLALAPTVAQHFDALFILRSVWHLVRMHKYPKLQAWRYAQFHTLLPRYLAGESLYAWLYSKE